MEDDITLVPKHEVVTKHNPVQIIDYDRAKHDNVTHAKNKRCATESMLNIGIHYGMLII